MKLVTQLVLKYFAFDTSSECKFIIGFGFSHSCFWLQQLAIVKPSTYKKV